MVHRQLARTDLRAWRDRIHDRWHMTAGEFLERSYPTPLPRSSQPRSTELASSTFSSPTEDHQGGAGNYLRPGLRYLVLVGVDHAANEHKDSENLQTARREQEAPGPVKFAADDRAFPARPALSVPLAGQASWAATSSST
jgi:hypothetical protein